LADAVWGLADPVCDHYTAGMTPKIRNLSVGLVVLLSLGTLGWLMFQFGAAPARFFKPPQFEVTFLADRGDGLGDGSTINYRGVEVGRVMSVKRDATTDRIVIDALVYQEPPLPANLRADITFSSPLGGVSSLELKIDGAAGQGQLADGATLEARYLGSTFLPPEFSELARNLNDSIQQFNDAKLIESLRTTIELTRQRIDQTGKVIEGVSSLVNDPEMRKDLKDSLASIRLAAEDTRKITEQVNTLVGQLQTVATNADKAVGAATETLQVTGRQVDNVGTELGTQLVKVGKLLDEVNEIAGKINTGAGTAGLMVNDPKLYQALVDSGRELNLTITDVRRLIQQWEQEGVSLKFGR
jgi:phospholipid/cholesterol/gamma-HCH transport system substrate-binding protein